MGNNSKKIAGKKRRRVRWGRVCIFLTLLVSIFALLGWGVYHAFVAVRDTYQTYSSAFVDSPAQKPQQPKFQDKKFDSYTNILLLGIDDGDPANPLMGKRADTVIMLSIDHETGFLRFLSIPGDTKVRIAGQSEEEKINRAYYYGGIQLAVRTVEDFLQAPIHHFVVLDTGAFTELVDLLGGVELYVESDMDYADAYAGYEIHLKKGYQYLDGAKAAQYARYRSDELGDIGRVQRQQKLLKALYAKAMDFDAVVKLPEIADLIDRRVTTSMAMLDTAKVVRYLTGFHPDMVKMEMLPGYFATEDYMTYWIPDQIKSRQLLDEMFIGGEYASAEQTPNEAAEK